MKSTAQRVPGMNPARFAGELKQEIARLKEQLADMQYRPSSETDDPISRKLLEKYATSPEEIREAESRLQMLTRMANIAAHGRTWSNTPE